MILTISAPTLFYSQSFLHAFLIKYRNEKKCEKNVIFKIIIRTF